MARKRAVSPTPAYLEELMLLLEAQAEPDHEAAINAVQAAHPGLLIDLDAELADHPEINDRYRRWWQRITRGLKDAAVRRALAGRGSASAALKEVRNIDTVSGKTAAGERPPLVLTREHAARVADYRRW